MLRRQILRYLQPHADPNDDLVAFLQFRSRDGWFRLGIPVSNFANARPHDDNRHQRLHKTISHSSTPAKDYGPRSPDGTLWATDES
jgi:hypothetical protein